MKLVWRIDRLPLIAAPLLMVRPSLEKMGGVEHTVSIT